MDNEVMIEVIPIKLGEEFNIKNLKEKVWKYKYTVREEMYMEIDYNDIPQGLYMMVRQNFIDDYDYLLILKDNRIIKIISL